MDYVDVYVKSIQDRLEAKGIDRNMPLAETRKVEETLSKECLVENNLLFVVTIAQRYGNSMVSMCDLIQEGNMGMMEAAKRFDPKFGVKFITYATPWIKKYIKRFFQTSSIVKHSDVCSISGSVDSIDGDIEFDDINEFIDGSSNSVNPCDMIVDNETNNNLWAIIGTLSQKERDLLEVYHGVNSTQAMSVKELARIESVSDQTIRNRLKDIEYKVRMKMNILDAEIDASDVVWRRKYNKGVN